MSLKKVIQDLQRPSDERHAADAVQLEERVMMSASPLAAAVMNSDAAVQVDGGVTVVDQADVQSSHPPNDPPGSQHPFAWTFDDSRPDTVPGEDQSFRFTASEDE